MSDLEAEMLYQLKATNLTAGMEREFKFHPKRRWRFDFAWPEKKVALETEGGVWSGGRHTSAVGFILDCEKYNAAALGGWKVLRVVNTHVKSGDALRWVEQAVTA